MLAEYDEVLRREKFHFKEKSIQMVLTAVKEFEMEFFRSLLEKFWLLGMI